MRMKIKDTKTGGAVSVKVTMDATSTELIIHWEDTDFVLPIDAVVTVIAEDDGK